MHLTADLLALLALGEDVATPEQHHHLAACAHCTYELDTLVEVVTVGRSLDHSDQLVEPGPEVWHRIQTQTRADSPPPLAAAGAEPTGPPTGPPAIEPPATVAPTTIERGPDAAGSVRRRRLLPVALAAAVALVVGTAIGLGIGLGTGLGPSRPDPPAPVVLAEAGLAPVDDRWPGASGTAWLERTPDGRRELVVQVDPGRPVTAWGEVWLIGPDPEQMVSLGKLDAEQDRYPVPQALDVADYPFVDVSAEPDDGQSAHSGNSIVRGELPH